MKKTMIMVLIAVMCLVFSFPCYAFDSIKRGDVGDNVKTVQQRLIDLGYLSGTADGKFGAKTEEAVLRFQTDNKLDATGIIGESTYNVLMGNVSEDSASVASNSTDTGDTLEVFSANLEPGAPLSTVDILESDYELKITDAGYTVRNGYLYYGVVLHNDSTDTGFQFPTVRIMARNADGALVGTYEQVLDEIYPDTDFKWGGLGCSINEEPAKVEFELSVDDYNIVPVTKLKYKESKPLEIFGVSEKDNDIFGKSYLGEVKNTNDYDLKGIAVVILYRDENGSLVGGDVTFTDGPKAGRTVPFELKPMSKLEAANYELSAVPWF